MAKEFIVSQTRGAPTGAKQVLELSNRKPVGEIIPVYGTPRRGNPRVEYWTGWLYKNPKSRRNPEPVRIVAEPEHKRWQDAATAVWDAHKAQGFVVAEVGGERACGYIK